MNIIKKFITFYQHQDGIIFWSTSASILLSLFLMIIFLFYLEQLPIQIPLFYSLPWGDTQLASKSQFVLLPSVILLIALVNLSITWYLHSSQLTMKRIIVFSTTMIALLATIAGMRIIFSIV
jgi:hypothetical protein